MITLRHLFIATWFVVCLSTASALLAAQDAAAVIERPNGLMNLAYVGNGAKPATSAAEHLAGTDAANLNDGIYGQGWCPSTPHAVFQIELAKLSKIGRFKYWRGGPADRQVQNMTIEVSKDGQQWQKVFEKQNLAAVPGFDPRWVMEIQIEPAEGKFVRGTVDPPGCALSEFEVLAPAAAPASPLPAIIVHDLTGRREIVLEKRYLNLPIKNHGSHRRMTISVDGRKIHELDIELADEKPDLWAFIDVSAYKGKTAKIDVNVVPEGSQGLRSIDQTDDLKNAATLYHESLRPQFHYTQRFGWNNDPNGMVYYDGEWHLFYQHHLVGWVWGGFTYWGHAVSKDLLHWEELPEALYPFVMAKGMCWSGSCVVDWQNTAGLQTGKEKVMAALFADMGAGGGEALAYSNDRGRSWTYFKDNPVLKHSGRDPKVFWYAPGKCWVMVVYDETGGVRNYAIYNSTDLKQWTLQSHLPGWFECPELFELPVDGDQHHTRWVVSGVTAQYAIGSFDGKKFTPDHPGKYVVHTGYYAAPQTFTDAPDAQGNSGPDIPMAQRRRIQIGWGKIDMPGMPFNQMMTFPTELSLRTTEDGIRMFAQPIREIEKLHQKTYSRADVALLPDKPLTITVNGRLLDIRAEFTVGQAKTLGFTIFGHYVLYDVAGQKLEGLPLKPVNGKIRLQILFDRSSVEVCGNDGRVFITTPMGPISKSQTVNVLTAGGEARLDHLDISELKSIWE